MPIKTVEEINAMISEIKEGIKEIQSDMKFYREEIKQSGDEIDIGLIEHWRQQLENSRGQLFMLEWVLT